MEQPKYDCYLTTIDNIYDPSEDFVAWFNEDKRLGYNCSAYLARVLDAYVPRLAPDTSRLSDDELTDGEKAAMNEAAIDAIIANDPTNLYLKLKVARK